MRIDGREYGGTPHGGHPGAHMMRPGPRPYPYPQGPVAEPGSNDWMLPGLRVPLPTPFRFADEGDDLFRYHPRDPSIRVSGSQQESPEESRSGAAKAAMTVGIGGAASQNVLDVGRLLKKVPEAARAAKFDPSLGRAGRIPTLGGLLALQRPDSRIIDPLAPRVASAASLGKSFTRIDEIAMKSSMLLGTSVSAIQVGTSIPNLVDAVRTEGPWHENLAATTSGRAGVLQLAGGSIGVTLFGLALRQTRGQGDGGVIPRMLTAAKAPLLARPIWGKVGIGSFALVLANETGYFDKLNSGESRSGGTVLREAAHKTPVLNDAAWRTAAIGIAGSVVGYKSHRAIQAAGGLGGGGLAGLGKGHVIGGAIVGGLLGAQLLGGLKVLDA